MEQRSYRMEKMHILIAIIATTSVTVGFVIRNLIGLPDGSFTKALWISAFIVGFYIVGIFAKAFVFQQIFPEPEEILLEEADASAELMSGDIMSDDMTYEGFDDVVMEDSMYNDSMMDVGINEERLESVLYSE